MPGRLGLLRGSPSSLRGAAGDRHVRCRLSGGRIHLRRKGHRRIRGRDQFRVDATIRHNGSYPEGTSEGSGALAALTGRVFLLPFTFLVGGDQRKQVIERAYGCNPWWWRLLSFT